MEIVQSARVSVLLPVACLALASCGGGSGGGAPSAAPPPVQNLSVGGIWKGTTSSGEVIVGLVTESGEFTFMRADGVQYFCNMSVSGSQVSSGFTVVAPVGATFPGGGTSGSGSLKATVTEHSSLNGSITFSATAGAPAGAGKVAAVESPTNKSGSCGSAAAAEFKGASGQSASSGESVARLATTSGQVAGPVGGTFVFAYDVLYDRDSSLAAMTGTFSGPGGRVVSVYADGNIFSQDAATGCVINGKVSTIDERFNVYRVQYTYGNCTGDFAALNGATFGGLATLDNSAAPEKAVIAVRYQSDSKALGVVEVLSRI